MGGLDSKAGDLEVVALTKGGLSLQAVDTSGGVQKLAGVILGTLYRRGEENPMYEEVNSVPFDWKFQNIIEITDYGKTFVQRIVYDELGHNEFIEGVMLSVASEYAGQGIARALVSEFLEVARRRGVRAVYIGCSSVYTAKIMQRLGFQEVATIPYKEYLRNGQPVFPVKAPHEAFRGFLKIVDLE